MGHHFDCCQCRTEPTTTTTTTTATTTTTTKAPSGGGCFHSTLRVQLKNGKLLPMSELQKGDKVQTGRDINLKCFIFYHFLDFCNGYKL